MRGEHLVRKPADRVDIWPEVERAAEDEQGVVQRERTSPLARNRCAAEMCSIDAIGHDADRHAACQPAQCVSIFFRDGDDTITAAHHLSLVARQLEPLGQRVSGGVPAPWPPRIGEKGPALQDELGVELVEDEF